MGNIVYRHYSTLERVYNEDRTRHVRSIDRLSRSVWKKIMFSLIRYRVVVDTIFENNDFLMFRTYFKVTEVLAFRKEQSSVKST